MQEFINYNVKLTDNHRLLTTINKRGGLGGHGGKGGRAVGGYYASSDGRGHGGKGYGRGKGGRLPYARATENAASRTRNNQHGSTCHNAHFKLTLHLFLLGLGICLI